MERYSEEFKNWINDDKKIKSLAEGCSVFGANYKDWKSMRHIIVNAINKDGTFLDVGCGNGFLLRCLQEWSDYKLEPYGVDRNPEYIKQAKELFSSKSNNFLLLNFWDWDLTEIPKYGVPNKYDFVYWAVRNSMKFDKVIERKFIETLLQLVSDDGRLILGLYESDNNLFDKLGSFGFKFNGFLENPATRIVWIDK